MGAKWVSSLYCIGNTLLQGMFCLGEIASGDLIAEIFSVLRFIPFFRHDIQDGSLRYAQAILHRYVRDLEGNTVPQYSRLPKAQTVVISFGAFLMAGLAMAFSLATSITVLKPKTWSDGERYVVVQK